MTITFVLEEFVCKAIASDHSQNSTVIFQKVSKVMHYTYIGMWTLIVRLYTVRSPII